MPTHVETLKSFIRGDDPPQRLVVPGALGDRPLLAPAQ